MARCMRDRRLPAVQLASEPMRFGNSAEHQPPLRPDAPYPAISASSTAIRRLGSAVAR